MKATGLLCGSEIFTSYSRGFFSSVNCWSHFTDLVVLCAGKWSWESLNHPVMWVVKSHMSRGVNLGVGHYPPVRGQGPETPPPIMWFVQVTWFKVWTGFHEVIKGAGASCHHLCSMIVVHCWCRWPPLRFSQTAWPFSFRMHTYSWVSCRDDSPRWCSSLNCASHLVFGSCQPKWALTFVTLISHMMKRALLTQWATPWFRLLLTWSFMSHVITRWVSDSRGQSH